MLAVLATLLLAGAAKAISLTRCTGGCRPVSATSAPSPEEPASLTIEPGPGASNIAPVAPGSVTAQTRTLTDVVVVTTPASASTAC